MLPRLDLVHEEEVAKLVMRFYPEFQSYKMRDRPDVALCRKDNSLVGLEIVRLVHEQLASPPDVALEICDALQSLLVTRGVQGRFFVYFDESALKDTQQWKRSLPQGLARVIDETAGSLEADELRNRGIQRVKALERRVSDTTCVIPGVCISAPIEGQTLVARALAKKHQRLKSYQLDPLFREHWLALIGFGPGSIEDGGITRLLQRQYDSNFDRLLLIEFDSRTLTKVHDVTAQRRA